MVCSVWFSRESRCILSFLGVRSGQADSCHARSWPAWPTQSPSIARARFLPETVSTAPKNRCRIHARVERTRPLTGTCVEGRSGFKSDGWFVHPTYCWVYVIWRLIGLYHWGGSTTGSPTLSAKGDILLPLDYNFLHSYSRGMQERWKHTGSVITWPTSHYHHIFWTPCDT